MLALSPVLMTEDVAVCWQPKWEADVPALKRVTVSLPKRPGLRTLQGFVRVVAGMRSIVAGQVG